MLDLGSTFLQSVERSPRAIAIIDGTLRLGYAEWYERISGVVAGLGALGIGRNDHVVVVLPNRWEAATVHWACQFLGAIVTPLNWRAKADELEYCVNDAEAKVVFFDAASAEAVAGCGAAGSLPRVSVGGAPGGTLAFDSLLRAARPAVPAEGAIDDFSLMLYTSGTTGKPKGVPRRQRAERLSALAHAAQNLFRQGERSLGVMPLYHTMGVRTLLSSALVDGVFVCMSRFDAGHALRIIAEERVSSMFLVPTLFHDLLAHPDFAHADLSSVTKLGFAGAPMHDALVHRLVAAFKPQLFLNHYGSSEVYTLTIDQDAARKPGSAGRAGMNSRARVVALDARDAQQSLPTGSEGQIAVDLAAGEAFEGYWKRPDADAKALRGGWYFTGDTGYIDADGDLFVTGRVDDMIISGGENISPVDIESVLSLHPAVDEVSVAGLKDERWGQRVVAFVKRKREVDAAVLDAHCKASELVNFKRPRQYVFVREIPKSPVGKILRRKLVAGEYEAE
jgi:2-furoate---CoA ligase